MLYCPLVSGTYAMGCWGSLAYALCGETGLLWCQYYPPSPMWHTPCVPAFLQQYLQKLGCCVYLICMNVLVFTNTTFTSYVFITSSISSTKNREKALTGICRSHVIMALLCFGSAACIYLQPPDEPGEVALVYYTNVGPLLIPSMHRLRNEDVKLALKKTSKKKSIFWAANVFVWKIFRTKLFCWFNQGDFMAAVLI